MTTESFCPIDYGFKWSDDWYEFDYPTAKERAKKARNERAKDLKFAGYKITATSNKQLITKGGIGTNHPQIDEWVTVYYIHISGDIDPV